MLEKPAAKAAPSLALAIPKSRFSEQFQICSAPRKAFSWRRRCPAGADEVCSRQYIFKIVFGEIVLR